MCEIETMHYTMVLYIYMIKNIFLLIKTDEKLFAVILE